MPEFTSKDFTAQEYITKIFKNATEHDLNEALSALTKSLHQNDIDSKNLVATHFEKFIECRAVVDSIYAHMKENDYLSILHTHSIESFSALSIKDYTSHTRKNEIRRQFSKLLSLSYNLKNAATDDEFVRLNSDALEEKKKATGSQYLESVWNESEGQRRDFLERMVVEIENRDCRFDEMMRFFDMYFRVESMLMGEEMQRKDENMQSVSREKIENTILVNVKSSLERVFNENDMLESLDESRGVMVKVLKYDVSARIKLEVVQKVLDGLGLKVDAGPLNNLEYRIVVRELDEVIEEVGDSIITATKYTFIGKVNVLISKMMGKNIYSMIDDKSSIREWCTVFEERIKTCCGFRKEKNNEFLKSKIRLVIERRIKDNHVLEEIKYLRGVFIKHIMKILDEEMIGMKDIIDALSREEEDELEKVLKVIEDELLQINKRKYENLSKYERLNFTVPEIMMKVLKIIQKYPNTYKTVIKRIYFCIEDNVSRFYLKDIVGKFEENLIDEEIVVYEKYKKHFGFLQDSQEIKEEESEAQQSFKKLEKTEEFDKEKALRIDIGSAKKKDE